MKHKLAFSETYRQLMIEIMNDPNIKLNYRSYQKKIRELAENDIINHKEYNELMHDALWKLNHPNYILDNDKG